LAIRIRLDRLLMDRRMSLSELADRTGVTTANLALLKAGQAQAIRLRTLEALCRELRCQPGELLVIEEDG
jgi:putative transcriptional regulator